MPEITDDSDNPVLPNLTEQLETHHTHITAIQHLITQLQTIQSTVSTAESVRVEYDEETELGRITLFFEFYDRDMHGEQPALPSELDTVTENN